MLQRRAVLAALGSAMVATVAPLSAFANVHVTCRQKFAEIVGGTVHLTDSDGEVVKARLVSLDDGPRHPGLEQFSIVFEGDNLQEGLYELSHPGLGRLPVSLIPSDSRHAQGARGRAFFTLFV